MCAESCSIFFYPADSESLSVFPVCRPSISRRVVPLSPVSLSRRLPLPGGIPRESRGIQCGVCSVLCVSVPVVSQSAVSRSAVSRCHRLLWAAAVSPVSAVGQVMGCHQAARPQPEAAAVVGRSVGGRSVAAGVSLFGPCRLSMSSYPATAAWAEFVIRRGRCRLPGRCGYIGQWRGESRLDLPAMSQHRNTLTAPSEYLRYRAMTAVRD